MFSSHQRQIDPKWILNESCVLSTFNINFHIHKIYKQASLEIHNCTLLKFAGCTDKYVFNIPFSKFLWMVKTAWYSHEGRIYQFMYWDFSSCTQRRFAFLPFLLKHAIVARNNQILQYLQRAWLTLFMSKSVLCKKFHSLQFKYRGKWRLSKASKVCKSSPKRHTHRKSVRRPRACYSPSAVIWE